MPYTTTRGNAAERFGEAGAAFSMILAIFSCGVLPSLVVTVELPGNAVALCHCSNEFDDVVFADMALAVQQQLIGGCNELGVPVWGHGSVDAPQAFLHAFYGGL